MNNKYAFQVVNKVYTNAGNARLIDLLSMSRNLLDIGCGAGDNAILIKKKSPHSQIQGVTFSGAEAEIAQKHMIKCWVFDIEQPIPIELKKQQFDCLVFSHVLEHLRNPDLVLASFSKLLKPDGHILIAVPNILSWRMRLQFLMGKFEYQLTGELDETHLRFFTYFTADKYLLSKCSDLHVVCKSVSGSFPLWWLRRHLFSQNVSQRIDQWACQHWPNLFGNQVLIKAVKR